MKKAIGFLAVGAALAGIGYGVYRLVQRVLSEEELLKALEDEFPDEKAFEDGLTEDDGDAFDTEPCSCEHCTCHKEKDTPVTQEEMVADPRVFTQDGQPCMRPKSEVEAEMMDDGFEPVTEDMDVPFEESESVEEDPLDEVLDACERAVPNTK